MMDHDRLLATYEAALERIVALLAEREGPGVDAVREVAEDALAEARQRSGT